MEDNKKSLFREKSIKSIESPEVLDQYLRVTSPGVWVTLGAVIVLLIGALVWAVFGKVESRVSVAIVMDQEKQCAYVPKDALQTVISERTVMVDETEVELAPKSIEPLAVTEDWDIYVMMAGNLHAGDIVYPIPVSSPLDNGIYTGTIITEYISPIFFLLN